MALIPYRNSINDSTKFPASDSEKESLLWWENWFHFPVKDRFVPLVYPFDFSDKHGFSEAK